MSAVDGRRDGSTGKLPAIGYSAEIHNAGASTQATGNFIHGTTNFTGAARIWWSRIDTGSYSVELPTPLLKVFQTAQDKNHRHLKPFLRRALPEVGNMNKRIIERLIPYGLNLS